MSSVHHFAASKEISVAIRMSSNLFVKVADSEAEESVEVPVEAQGYILMSTLTAQFPGACGLKFKTEQFSWRG